MRRFAILSSGRVIGWSDLEGKDQSLGVAVGRFVPTADYAFLQPIFLLWTEATTRTPQDDRLLVRYFEAAEKLGLTVQSAEGEVIPAAWIHITDYSRQLGAEGYEVSVSVAERADFERYFPGE